MAPGACILHHQRSGVGIRNDLWNQLAIKVGAVPIPSQSTWSLASPFLQPAYNPPPTTCLPFSKIQRRSPLQLRLAHVRRPPFVLADRGQNVANVGRVASSQLGPPFAHAQLAQIFGAVRLARDVKAAHDAVENLVESLVIHGVDENLVVNTA